MFRHINDNIISFRRSFIHFTKVIVNRLEALVIYPTEIIPWKRSETKKVQDSEVELELPEELLLVCLLCAHEENITFNEWINKIIREEINKNG